MGNQARVADGATVISTSTRNFPNRMGKGAFVYLASAELAAVCALLGRIPSPEEYLAYVESLDGDKDDTYRYMNFNEIQSYMNKADNLIFQTAA